MQQPCSQAVPNIQIAQEEDGKPNHFDKISIPELAPGTDRRNYSPAACWDFKCLVLAQALQDRETRTPPGSQQPAFPAVSSLLSKGHQSNRF